MNKAIMIVGLALLALPFAGAAHAAGTTELDLLGKDPGNTEAYSCYVRHYDAAHLASHPQQNVRNMSLFVDSRPDDSIGRTYQIEIGVDFRREKAPLQISGSCMTNVDGKQAMSCGADCDGGHFDVTTQGKQSILVSIPDYIRIWDPKAPDDQPDKLPKGAEFGKDDKLFRLDRTDLSVCKSLMTDDQIAAIFGKKK